jgi:hypothetical protein
MDLFPLLGGEDFFRRLGFAGFESFLNRAGKTAGCFLFIFFIAITARFITEIFLKLPVRFRQAEFLVLDRNITGDFGKKLL